MSDDLAAFWAARLDEDEAAAVAAAEADKYGVRPNWSALGNIIIDASDPDWAVVDLGPCFEDASVGAHIARHDPARALREVEAKRTIMRRHEEDRHSPGRCSNCCYPTGEHMPWPCDPVRILVAVHNDHLDYQEAWKP